MTSKGQNQNKQSSEARRKMGRKKLDKDSKNNKC